MVKKLYKHEFLAWLRVMPMIFGITLLTAAFHRILQFFETDSTYYNIVNGSAIFLFVVALLVCLAAPVVFGIIRFYKNLFTGEGYLTFTLPVKNTTHLLVKSTTTLVFCVAAVFVCIGACCLITAGDVLTELWKAGVYLIHWFPDKYIGHFSGYMAEGCLLLLVATFSTILLYNFCLCVGQQAKKNRIMRSVGTYFGYYILSQILGTILLIVITVMDANGALVAYYRFFEAHPLATIHIFMGIAIVWFALLGLVFWLISRYILRRKLNLE